MQGAIRLTAEDLAFQFADAYDPILHEPFCQGDLVCRCSKCKTILKAEHVHGSCPLCDLTPFVASAVNPPEVVEYSPTSRNTSTTSSIGISYHRRKKRWLAFWCFIASLFALCPLYLFDMEWLFADMSTDAAAIAVLALAFTTSLVLLLCSATRQCWQDNTFGPLLLSIPILAPYGITVAVWAIVWLLSIMLGLLAVVFIFSVLLAIFNS